MFVAEIGFHDLKNNFVYATSSTPNGFHDLAPVCLYIDLPCGKGAYVTGFIEPFLKRVSKFYTLKFHPFFANQYNLRPGDKVGFKVVHNVKKCAELDIDVASQDDWEIVQTNTNEIEHQLLDQINVVAKNMNFPLWVNNSLCVYFKVASTSPEADCVLLNNDTVLNLKPAFGVNRASYQKKCSPTSNRMNMSIQSTAEIPLIIRNSKRLHSKKSRSFESESFRTVLDDLIDYCETSLMDFDCFCGHVVVEGLPCSGTTHLAEKLSHALSIQSHVHVKSLDCKTLNGKSLDSVTKALGQLFDDCFGNEPSLLILDDLDQLCSSSSATKQLTPGAEMHFVRFARILLKFLDCVFRDRLRCICVATCKSRSKLHESLTVARGKRYFTKFVKTPDLNANDRRNLICQYSVYKSIRFHKDALRKLVNQTEGCVAGDLHKLVDRVALAVSRSHTPNRSFASDDDIDFAVSGFESINLHKAKSRDSQPTLGDVDWEDVGGMAEIKQHINRLLLWPSKHKQIYSALKIRMAGGLLLYGPSGTGKTLLAAVTAKHCNLNCIFVKGAELLSKYIGASEEAVRNTFARARSVKPSMILFDEFDALAPRRGHDSTGVTDRVVNQLLTELDGVEPLEGVYIMATSSRPDLIDPAFLRPGRIDRSFYCALPNEVDRVDILRRISNKIKLDTDVHFKIIAEKTGKFSGADLKSLIYNAQLSAFYRTDKNFDLHARLKSRRLTEASRTNQNSSILLHLPNLESQPAFKEHAIGNGVFEASKSHSNPILPSAKYSSVNGNSTQIDTNKPTVVVVSMSDVENALLVVKPSVTDKEIERFEYLNKAFDYSSNGINRVIKNNQESTDSNGIGFRTTLA